LQAEERAQDSLEQDQVEELHQHLTLVQVEAMLLAQVTQAQAEPLVMAFLAVVVAKIQAIIHSLVEVAVAQQQRVVMAQALAVAEAEAQDFYTMV
jgi:hypothetical protein